MVEKSSGKRFGVIAIEKGFITKEQFMEAMGLQIDNNLEGIEHRSVGSVLHSMGYMTVEQIGEVLEAMTTQQVDEIMDNMSRRSF
ncbi:MAG: hypothetical protein V2A69_14095 [Pseudomonadota bacterium]